MTGSLTAWPVQQAFYEQLTADTALMAMVDGVFDTAPITALYPYITLGTAEVIPWKAQGSSGNRFRFTLMIYSQAAGRKEALAIADRICHVLDGEGLNVTGTIFAHCQFARYRFVSSEKEVTTRLQMDFSVITQNSGG